MKRIYPSLLALFGSAIAAAGLYCAVTFVICMGWGGPDSYPIAIPVSIAGILGCLCLFVAVSYWYIRLCLNGKRKWLILADMACFIFPFFLFFNFWRILASILDGLIY